MFFKELLHLFGVHLMLFFYLLKQCGSGVPKLLVGADIIFEDVFGKEIRLPYRKYRHWGNFNDYLLNSFLEGRGKQYVTTGKFRLYDYQGSSLTKERWQKLVPNSKVIMSVIIQLSDHNACGRCFKKEDSLESGVVKCSNCGLTYSKIGLSSPQSKPTTSRITEITENGFSTKESEQPGQPILQGTDLTKSIDSVLGYDRELEYFTRIDFEVAMTSEPLGSIIRQLAELFKLLFTLVEQQGHRGPMSSAELSSVQGALRSCYAEFQALIKERWFSELEDNGIYLLSLGDIDDEACLNIRRSWVSLRFEALTIYRQFLSDRLFTIPKNLGYLLTSCSYCVKRLRASHGGTPAIQDYQMQLILLEQQNKKRLMMLRQGQEDIRAFQYYQMQRMLLEQQNKRRLMIPREEPLRAGNQG